MNNSFASASLYVGDLAPDVSEAILFDVFNVIGPVASIRVCRDAVTRRSLGYAYVNFHQVGDAERALEILNYTHIPAPNGRPCRIMWSHRDPSMRKSGVGNIFIKNLDKGIDHKALYDTFSVFGNILSCKVQTDSNNQSLGYGFVHYEKHEEAEQAIAKVNGMLLNDKKVYVGHFIPGHKRQETQGESRFTNIYIKNLAETVDEERLKAIFGEHGRIANAIIMRDGEGKSKGFGFVNFEDPEDARKVLDSFADKEIDGQIISVNRAQKKAERERELRKKFEQLKLEKLNRYQGVNLYVKNLDDTITEAQLIEEFGSFGQISSAKVMTQPGGGSRGFGFVCFNTTEEATKALAEMNGRMVGTKPIYVALAQRKDVRRAQLEAQHQRRASNMMATTGMGFMPGGQPMFYPNLPATRPGGFVYPGRNMVGPAGPRWQPGQGGQGGAQGGGGGRGGYPMGGGYPMQGGMPGQPGGGGGGGRGRGRGQNRGNQQMGGRGGMGGGRGGPKQPAAGGAAAPRGEDLASQLSAASPQEQKQMLGERLFPLIHRHQPVLAGKITGMLLEMDNGELLILLDNPQDLAEKVAEAVNVLKDHAAKEGKTLDGVQPMAGVDA